MTTYVFRDGGFRDKRTGEPMPMPDRGGKVCAPMVIGDIPDHVGPDGKIVSSRSGMRDACKRTGTVPWEPVRPSKERRGFVDRKTAAAAGVEVCGETIERVAASKKAAFKAAGIT